MSSVRSNSSNFSACVFIGLVDRLVDWIRLAMVGVNLCLAVVRGDRGAWL